MREFINKYGTVVGISVLILALLVYWFVIRGSSNPNGNQAYAFFIDEDTGAESILPADEVPPLVGKSGKASVVKEIKYSCDGGRTIDGVYWIKYTPEAQNLMKTLPADDSKRADASFAGELVRSPKAGSPWVSLRTAEGDQVTRIPTCPQGKTVAQIYPRK